MSKNQVLTAPGGYRPVKKTPPRKPISLRMPESYHLMLERLAADLEVDKADILRTALRRFYQERFPSPAAAFRAKKEG